MHRANQDVADALQNSPSFKQCDIKYVPIFLGGLMKTCGNTAPIAIKSKSTSYLVVRDIQVAFSLRIFPACTQS